jgi:phenol hydroxylase P5 protein
MSYEVTVEPAGVTVEVEEGQTILDAALRQGVYIPHACGHGLCGTCKVDVLEGDVDQGNASDFALMDMEREEGKCLACCATPESDLVVEADVDEEPDAENHVVQDYTALVSKIEQFTPRVKGIFLALEGRGLDFQAGQYINLNIPGLEDAPRAFSISSPPSERNLVELNVALVEGGKGTEYLHNELKVGDEITFSSPYGRFFTRVSMPEPIIFFAGGSGLSSPKSMILDLIEKGDDRPITLVYGARNQDELYYRELFEELANEHESFTFIPALSDEPENSDWQGHRGYVHEVAEAHFNGKFEGYKAYMCGPPVMIDACINVCIKGRLFERDMYMEKFLTAADAETEAKRSPLFKAI